MSDAQTLMTALDAAGLPPNRVHLSAPPTPDAPAPPEEAADLVVRLLLTRPVRWYLDQQVLVELE